MKSSSPIEAPAGAASWERKGPMSRSATRFLEAGIADAEALAETDRDTLLGIEGIDEDLADSLMEWADARVKERDDRTGAEIGALFRAPEKPSTSMGDEDFMAALSRAFQESEHQRASTKSDDEADGDTKKGEE